jgi:hypothetical protein
MASGWGWWSCRWRWGAGQGQSGRSRSCARDLSMTAVPPIYTKIKTPHTQIIPGIFPFPVITADPGKLCRKQLPSGVSAVPWLIERCCLGSWSTRNFVIAGLVSHKLGGKITFFSEFCAIVPPVKDLARRRGPFSGFNLGGESSKTIFGLR